MNQCSSMVTYNQTDKLAHCSLSLSLSLFRYWEMLISLSGRISLLVRIRAISLEVMHCTRWCIYIYILLQQALFQLLIWIISRLLHFTCLCHLCCIDFTAANNIVFNFYFSLPASFLKQLSVISEHSWLPLSAPKCFWVLLSTHVFYLVWCWASLFVCVGA